MIRLTSYIVLLIFLFGCKGKKQVASSVQPNEKQVINAEKRLKSVFIDAKKEQVIGNTENAQALFNKVLTADPSCNACAYELANIAVKLKDAGSAEKMSALAFKGEPNNPNYRRQRAEVVYMLGDPKKAGQISKTLIDSFPKSRDHYRRTIFYFEKSEMFEEAEIVLNSYQRQFGFSSQTAMMYDYLYKLSNDNEKIEGNWAALIKKYPNDIGHRKKYISTLIENNKIEQANVQIDVLSTKMNQPSYAHLLKAKIAANQKNWAEYLNYLKLADADKTLDGNTKYLFLIKTKEIKDSSIVQIVRGISKEEPKAIEVLHFYQEQFGEKTTGLSYLEEQYKASPTNAVVAKKLYDAYTDNNQFLKANRVSLELVEDNPSHFEYYILHAKSLIANGKFADAYAYANQGLAYAIDKNEICAVHTIQALSNHYLFKKENVTKELEKAWGNLGDNQQVKEDLISVSMLAGGFDDKIKNELASLDKSYIVSLLSLYQSDAYNKVAWQKLSTLYPKNQLIQEAWIIKAIENKQEGDFSVLKQMLLRKFPSHGYYKSLRLK